MKTTHRVAPFAVAIMLAVTLLFALPVLAFADEVPDADNGDMAAQATPYKNKYASYWDAVSAFMADKRFAPGASWTDADEPKLDLTSHHSGCAAYVTDYGIFVFGSGAFDWPEYANPSDIQAIIWITRVTST